jgi:hypothetical protein
MVSAWAQENHLTLGQVKVEEKSNEITAIPRLLEVLVLKGCLVTIQAEDSFRFLHPASSDEQTDAGHGRVETHRCLVS